MYLTCTHNHVTSRLVALNQRNLESSKKLAINETYVKALLNLYSVRLDMFLHFEWGGVTENTHHFSIKITSYKQHAHCHLCSNHKG